MADETVSISYQAYVRGIEQVQQLTKANQDLQKQIQNQTVAVNNATTAIDKHKSILQQTHAVARNLHREMFAGVFVFGLVTGALRAMAAGSESAQIGLDQLTSSANRALGAFGNWAARGVAFWGAIAGGASPSQALQIADEQTAAAKSFETKVKLLQMEANLFKTKGDDLMALKKKQAAEDVALEKDRANKSYDAFKAGLDRQHAAELEAFRLHSLGLKQEAEIQDQFRKQVVGGSQQTASNVMQNFLNGQKQSGMDVLKAFQANFNKAVSDAFTQSLFSGQGIGGFFDSLKNIFSGNSPAKQTADNTKKIADVSSIMQECMCRASDLLARIADCTCATASGLRSMSATVTPPKTSGLQKALSLSNLVGSVAGLGTLGGFGGGGGGQLPADIIMAPNVKGHSGGMIGFPSGGEVPIMAMPGEYIVRRPAAMANKDLLRDINSGGKQVQGTQNVFLIKANDAASFTAMLSSPSAQNQMEINIIRAIMGNGNIRNIIKNFAN